MDGQSSVFCVHEHGCGAGIANRPAGRAHFSALTAKQHPPVQGMHLHEQMVDSVHVFK
jgi:hypothetical protein